MFESYDYASILERILSRLPKDEDTRPSSPLYILSAPAAKELETAHRNLDYTIEQVFPTTQDREHLIRDAQTYGMAPYDAKPAVAEGEFDIKVDLGSRFSIDQGRVDYAVSEYMRAEGDYHYYRMTCEQTGEIGNVAPGKLIPIWNIPGLKHAYLTRILIPGEEEEPTEDFRARYLDFFRHPRYGGNLADYINEVCAFEGVGRCKILRCRDFKGEPRIGWVGIVITDAAGNKPTQELIDDLQEYMQPLGVSGLPEIETSGLGRAPIQHRAYVRGVRERVVDVGVRLAFTAGASWTALRENIEEAARGYLKELALSWGDVITTEKAKYPFDDHLVVRRAEIETRLMDIGGVLDVAGLTINGKARNLDLDWDEIPVMGGVVDRDTEDPGGGNECPYECPDCPCGGDMSLCGRLGG